MIGRRGRRLRRRTFGGYRSNPVTPSQGVGLEVLPLLVLVSLAFAPVPTPVPPSSEIDLEIFQGKWVIWENGKKMEASVEGNQITLWSEARAFKSCRIDLAASAKPKRLDLIEVHKIAGKVVDGFVWHAIYTIDKDTVTICSGISDDDRPHAFRQDEKASRRFMYSIARSPDPADLTHLHDGALLPSLAHSPAEASGLSIGGSTGRATTRTSLRSSSTP